MPGASGSGCSRSGRETEHGEENRHSRRRHRHHGQGAGRPGRRHPDRGRRDQGRRAVARRRGRGGHRCGRHDRPAGHHRCPHLPLADRAARLRARPVARHLQHQAAAAARPLHAGRQFQRRLHRRLRDAVLRHHDRRRLLPQHQQPRLRAALARGAEDGRHPAPVRIFVHDLPAGHLSAGGPVRRRAAHLRPLSRSRRHHDHRLRHRFDRRRRISTCISSSRAISRR